LPATDPGDDLALIAAAAGAAGRLAMRYFRADPQVWMKSGQSPVSEADLAVDRQLKAALTAARPDYGWLSEETADDLARLACRRTFVVDPIDGTRAFIDGQPHWCVSIAVVEAGRSLAGVLEAPARGETWLARRGAGATVNSRPARVAPARAKLRVAGPKALVDHAERALGRPVERSRYLPSLALRVALVASGELDATLVKAHAHDWDIAAADLILAEAGGALLGAGGAAPAYAGRELSHGELVAAAAPLARLLVPALAGTH